MLKQQQQQKSPELKPKEIWIKYGFGLIIYQYWFITCDEYILVMCGFSNGVLANGWGVIEELPILFCNSSVNIKLFQNKNLV
jgi:hypothetical protein